MGGHPDQRTELNADEISSTVGSVNEKSTSAKQLIYKGKNR